MTNTNESGEDLQPEVAEELISQRPTPGELLRSGREKLGLSVGQVSDRLRLRQQQIQELEDDVFTEHVSGTYIRGYLRSYAKLLQLSETEVLEAYNHLMGDQPAKGQMQSFSRKTSIETQDNRLMILTWVIVLILIGSVAVFVWQKFAEDRDQVGASNIESSLTADNATNADNTMGETDSSAPDSASTSNLQPNDDQLGTVDSGENSSNLAQLEPASQPNGAAVPGANPPVLAETTINTNAPSTLVSDSAVAAQIQAEEGEATSENANTQEVNSQEQNPAVEPTNPAAQGELVLVFSGDSWIRIEDGTGEAIAYGVKESGYVMPLNGNAPYDLTLGAPSVVAVYFRGERIDLSEFSGGRIARFSLPRS